MRVVRQQQPCFTIQLFGSCASTTKPQKRGMRCDPKSALGLDVQATRSNVIDTTGWWEEALGKLHGSCQPVIGQVVFVLPQHFLDGGRQSGQRRLSESKTVTSINSFDDWIPALSARCHGS